HCPLIDQTTGDPVQDGRRGGWGDQRAPVHDSRGRRVPLVCRLHPSTVHPLCFLSPRPCFRDPILKVVQPRHNPRVVVLHRSDQSGFLRSQIEPVQVVRKLLQPCQRHTLASRLRSLTCFP